MNAEAKAELGRIVAARLGALGLVFVVVKDAEYRCYGVFARTAGAAAEGGDRGAPWQDSFSPGPGGRYALSGWRAPAATGSGRIINLSSSGMNFTVDWPLRTGEKLDLYIDWPARLDGGPKLQLLISGVVVRTHGTTAALQIRRHEFRTRGEV